MSEVNDSLSIYRAEALKSVNFKLIQDNINEPMSVFKPDMAHQIFGENELIFGYKNLEIDLYYLHNSANCYVDIKYTQKLSEKRNPDDVMALLNPWLPTNFAETETDFKSLVEHETHDLMYGKVLDSFTNESADEYKVTLCDINDEDFKLFHERFETYIIWFIDAANFIDLDDSRWLIFYIYKETKNENKIIRTPIGFSTIYKFFCYPDLIRPRISQFIILPSYQKQGFGTKFYNIIYEYLSKLPNIQDITVEEPTPVLQKLRDVCDTIRIYNDLEKNKINLLKKPLKQRNQYMREKKICKKQSQRIIDLLDYLYAFKSNNDFNYIDKKIKDRITAEIERDTGFKIRVCMANDEASSQVFDKNSAIKLNTSNYLLSIKEPLEHLKKMI